MKNLTQSIPKVNELIDTNLKETDYKKRLSFIDRRLEDSCSDPKLSYESFISDAKFRSWIIYPHIYDYRGDLSYTNNQIFNDVNRDCIAYESEIYDFLRQTNIDNYVNRTYSELEPALELKEDGWRILNIDRSAGLQVLYGIDRKGYRVLRWLHWFAASRPSDYEKDGEIYRKATIILRALNNFVLPKFTYGGSDSNDWAEWENIIETRNILLPIEGDDSYHEMFDVVRDPKKERYVGDDPFYFEKLFVYFFGNINPPYTINFRFSGLLSEIPFPVMKKKDPEHVHEHIQGLMKKETFGFTDTDNAERFAAKFGRDVRYCHGQKTFYLWKKGCYGRDETGEAMWFTKETVLSIKDEIGYLRGQDFAQNYLGPVGTEEEDEKKKQAFNKKIEPYKKWMHQSKSHSRRQALLNSAKSERGIPVRANEFDTDPLLLNLRNGTMKLSTGDLYEHNRSYLCTKQCNAAYDPLARAHRWLEAIDLYCGGNKAKVKYLQRLSGYFLTGEVNRREIYFLVGPGSNGKSTYLKVMGYVMGNYGRVADYDTFLDHGKGRSARNDLARLHGARLVSAIEAGEGKRLDEALVKWISGDEKIAARFLFQETFEFDPTFKVVLASNHRPVIKGKDTGIWSRVVMIPFGESIPKSKQDKNLFEKLKKEKDGILLWALQGLKDYLENGMNPPPEITRSIDEYRAEMDVEKRFVTDNCIKSDTAFVVQVDLHESYGKWSRENGYTPEGKIKFNKTIEGYGFTRGRKTVSGKTENVWLGIGLKV